LRLDRLLSVMRGHCAVAQETADKVERMPGGITTSTIISITSEKRAMKALKIDSVDVDHRHLTVMA